MGEHENWAQPSGITPSGLLPNEGSSVTQFLDAERWSKAEARTAELIAYIQPNPLSEERRNAVAKYVQHLIMKCFDCQVFAFGSVPLKTYLPDGDIDLTACGDNQGLRDTWANQVRHVLESEEKNDSAQFHVKEVQYIQAEVKIIKCLVENIVVDISFNQIGGLCTLCFLEQVDNLISQNHLFKCSVILIKAWCYYESRILGAHHGLISTYALETLVLYIFHVFDNTFAGPLEVLYRFLEFFSNFDWDNFCVSLWGPVPIRGLPDMRAQPPRRDCDELLLSKHLANITATYAVFPGGMENPNQPFISKHFNVIDPLRINNNLGRSVSKGNFFRIRSAFSFGAKRLARLLECPNESVISEVNQFFMNTWERHGSRQRPDAANPDICNLKPSDSDSTDESENSRLHSRNKVGEPVGLRGEPTSQNTKFFHSHEDSSQAGSVYYKETFPRTNSTSSNSHTQVNKNYSMESGSRTHDLVRRNINSSDNNIRKEKAPKVGRYDDLASEHDRLGKYHLGRTQSSPELRDASGETLAQLRRNRLFPEIMKNQVAISRADNINRNKNVLPEISSGQSIRPLSDGFSSLGKKSFNRSLETTISLTSVSNSYNEETAPSGKGKDLTPLSEIVEMSQEDQDMINMTGLRMPNFSSQMPVNFSANQLSFPFPPLLAPIGYPDRNLPGIVNPNIPFIDPHWGTNLQIPPGMVPLRLSPFSSSVSMPPSSEEMSESNSEILEPEEINQQETDHGFWQEHDIGHTRGFDEDSEKFQMQQPTENHQSTSVPIDFGSLHITNSQRPMRGRNKIEKDYRVPGKDEHGDTSIYQNRGNNASNFHITDRSTNPRVLAEASSSRNKSNSENSWDGSSPKNCKTSKEKRGKKMMISSNPSHTYGKSKTNWQYEGMTTDHSSADEDNREWIPLTTMGNETSERNRLVSPSSKQLVQRPQFSVYGSAQVSGPAPMFVSSNSRPHMIENPGFVFLPMFVFPGDTGNSETGHNNRDINPVEQNFDSTDNLDQAGNFSGTASFKEDLGEVSEEPKSDILNSDFGSHWRNLQFGRICQNTRFPGTMMYPSQVVVPPLYLPGQFSWEGSGRPLSTNVNLYTHRLVPMAPVQPSLNRPSGVYQHYGEEVPRSRAGTGTYLPNPKASYRDRQSSNSRNHRGNFNYDRNDHSEKEGNWNTNHKSRDFSRAQERNQMNKPHTRSDRSWYSTRQDQYSSYQGQHEPIPNAVNTSAYNMYPLQTMNSNGASGTSAQTLPSVFMLYSYDQPLGFGSHAEHQVEFGSLGPMHFSGSGDASQLNDGALSRSSPDQPSSPQLPR